MTKTAFKSANEKVIEVKDLTVVYQKTRALENVSLDIKRGDYFGIIGPNGGGKSTLLKSIMGLIEISSGDIKILGQEADKGRTGIGYVPQIAEFDRGFPINVLEVVLSGMLRSGLQAFKRYSPEEKDLAYHHLNSVGIADLSKNHISALSGGQFQKMLIARALAVEPEILLLDEPTASVDATSRKQIFELLEDLNKDVTIVLVTHDLMAISSMADNLACLNTRLVYHGDPVLDDEIVTDLYGCPVDLIAHGVPHRVYRDEMSGGQ